MNVRASTPEEIEARRAEVAAAECRGDGVHTNDMRFWHDWRLWERERYVFIPRVNPEEGIEVSWRETWYCTRCRTIEGRTVRET